MASHADNPSLTRIFNLLDSIDRRLARLERRERVTNDTLIDATEARKILDCTYERLRGLVRRGEIDCEKSTTGRWRFRRAAVEQFATTLH